VNQTIAIDLILNCAKAFHSDKYPLQVYQDALARAASAQDAGALADALYVGLGWKDGKAQLDPDGDWSCLLDDERYRIAGIKDNTYSNRHGEVFLSPEFWNWATDLREQEYFDAALIDDVCEEFGLWNTVVMPAFLLHLLNPRYFPIVDRYVVRAANFLTNAEANDKVTRHTYEAYEIFWQRVLLEAGLDCDVADLDELKRLDNGLWALGRLLASSPTVDDVAGPRGAAPGQPPQASAAYAPSMDSRASMRGPIGTGSAVFKLRVLELARTTTQGRAMAQAAREFGIDLPASYLQYPGSHFDRWRKQGFGRS